MFAKHVFMAAILLAASSAEAGSAPISDGFIVVNADGSKARGTATFVSNNFDTGQYEIDVQNDIPRCVFSATAGSSDATPPPIGFAIAFGRGENHTAIMVSTFDGNGQPANRGFHLVVRCWGNGS